MCEKSKDAVKIINMNLEKTRLKDSIKLFNEDFEKCISKLDEKIDIVFLDPPYKSDYAYVASKLIIENDLLKEDSIIILETDSEQTVENQFEKLSLEEFDKKKYGRVHLLFYKIKK